MRKLLDPRINHLIKKICDENNRGLFVIIGDNAKDQVATLHSLLVKNSNDRCSSILWCYKHRLELSSNPKKRKRQKKKRFKTTTAPENDSFELFLSTNSISYVLYKDSQRALGRTFSMCVLQDFEALTPNILAQTIETVSGKGLVVILLRKMSSLKQLSEMNMDFYGRLRRSWAEQTAQVPIVARFNERFTISLSRCGSCLVVDDEMNVLPISSQKHCVKADSTLKKSYEEANKELECIKEEMRDSKPLCTFIDLCKTLDQAKTLLSLVDASIDKKNAVVSVTAARGRGKTFVCGLFVAYSLVIGKLTNIYVTSPYPQNLIPLFSSLRASIEALGYKEHSDFEEIHSMQSEHAKSIVRFNVFREHSQFVQFVSVSDCEILQKSQAQLLVIDEAAAIPLPITKNFLFSPCLTVLSSTTSGYEGTGRSLTLKLLKSLREATSNSLKGERSKAHGTSAAVQVGFTRPLRETELEEPIRYSPGDEIEAWLSHLLCLEAPAREQNFSRAAPHPSACSLYLVDRDSLFSGHKASEAFLSRVMSLYVSSHYKNSPNDLQLLSDAPEHRVFVLIGQDSISDVIPDVLCVLQVAFEGSIPPSSVQKGFHERIQSAGDLIPWTLSTQYQEKTFASLFGVRIVRIATHPDLQSMGYGKQALNLLSNLLSKQRPLESGKGVARVTEKHLTMKVEQANGATSPVLNKKVTSNAQYKNEGIHSETVEPKKNVPALLTKMDDIFVENVHWIGVSFGLTQRLFNFWSSAGFAPVYVRQSCNKLTGEHSCIMIKKMESNTDSDSEKIVFFQEEFLNRFMSLLSFSFRNFSSSLALSLFQPSLSLCSKSSRTSEEENKSRIKYFLSPNDIRRIKAYSSNRVDFTTIVDLVPLIAELFFKGLFSGLHLSFVQKAVFIAVGLQRRTVENLASELDLPTSQILGLFNKAIIKVTKHLEKLE